MIKQVDVINDRGEVLNMVLKSPEKSGLNITDISGIGPEDCEVNIDDSLNIDGGIYNSTKKPIRNIVFSIKFMDFPSVEDNRHKSYKFFRLRKEITLIFYTDSRKLYISGIVESNTPNIFSKEESCQISILCPDPYFRSAESNSSEEIVLDSVINGFEFPVIENPFTFGELSSFSGYKHVINVGNVDCQTLITLSGLILIPELEETYWAENDIIIKNITTNQEFKMRLTTTLPTEDHAIYRQDKIYISSAINNKYVIYESINNNDSTRMSFMNYVDKDSDWIKLVPGDNLFYSNVPIWMETYTASTEDGVLVSYIPLYEGV